MRIGKHTFHIGWQGDDAGRKGPRCKFCHKRVRFVSAKNGWTYQHVLCLLRNR